MLLPRAVCKCTCKPTSLGNKTVLIIHQAVSLQLKCVPLVPQLFNNSLSSSFLLQYEVDCKIFNNRLLLLLFFLECHISTPVC
uniref:Uncharacterized protein n=1 Tax=Anguilla anguilla TaxID=7936 RepID=A0A0E9VJP4_ANGAN